MASKLRIRTRAVPFPAWCDLSSKDRVGHEYLSSSISDGDLIEFKFGRELDGSAQGTAFKPRDS